MDFLNNPRYRGKHIILAAGRVYTAKTGDKAAEILQKIRKKYPGVTPETAFMPKGFLIV